ncbi:MAG: hypothetical protein MPI95_04340 [Nitrosopumilus sp.]|nr:hypothetical protein [Nitrosopumilus sp.]CAI9832762.1 conserved hypothetical protein [Nitrosopumilaceae archaeon]MDA7945380.1 hypothetical protein [Nitrosopumilus sp.]MDA7953046.1 hypothetical protein [Nitrosopumilus sp.]MDA7955060.1 hypothetical protein [Nitrosopumilus sp.]
MGEKGKHASATENRRFVWTEIVWPLVLALRSQAFTAGQYRVMRDGACQRGGVTVQAASRGLASLIQKGALFKEGETYSIHYRLIPYMRVGAACDYPTAMSESGM